MKTYCNLSRWKEVLIKLTQLTVDYGDSGTIFKLFVPPGIDHHRRTKFWCYDVVPFSSKETIFATKINATSTSFQIGLMGPFYFFDCGKAIAPQTKFLITFLQVPLGLMSDINKDILNTAFTGNISIQWVYHHHNKTTYIASKGLKI